MTWRCKFTYGFSTGLPLNTLIIYGENPNFLIILIIMPSAHGPIFVVSSSEKKPEWRSDFLSDQVSAQGQIFIADKIGGTLRFFIGLLFGAHSPIFLLDNDRRGPIVRLRHWFFIGLKSAYTDRFFIADKSSEENVRFIIGPKVRAHETIFTPIFCLR